MPVFSDLDQTINELKKPFFALNTAVMRANREQLH